MLTSTRIGQLDILWSVNCLARAVTKWNKACDKRLYRLTSCIHFTFCERQFFLSETLHQSEEWVLFKFLSSQETMQIPNHFQAECYVSLGAVRLCPKGWACKKQTAVTHSIAGAVKISLDAGLRLEGWISGTW